MNISKYLQPSKVRQVFLNFSGWPDAGGMIEATLEELKKTVPYQLAAVWDLDEYWHTEAIRPQVFIQHGQIKKIEWPGYRFHMGSLASGEAILMGSGPEPNCRWRSFVAELLGQLKEWGCSELYLLGSMFDQIFHDEVIISCVVQDARGYNLVHELGCERIEYEGPSAIHAAIMSEAPGLDIRCISLWVHLPFYLKGPHELVMSHLLQIVGKVIGVEPKTSHLLEEWRGRQTKIEDLIQQDQELKQTLQYLRQQERPQKPSSYPHSKILRLDDFIKKRNEPDPGPGPEKEN